MSGLAAYLAPDERATAGVVETMSAAAPHRGDRIETLVHGRCALAVADHEGDDRASIASVDGVAAAFAGSLDNAADLARDLAARGLDVASATPAALIARGHRVYGDALPARLRGVFTVAVTDGERLHCFRDHLGYGLLFYRWDGRQLHVATEAKQVVAGAGIPKQPDAEVVERIFFGLFDDDTPAALRGVSRLPKAHRLVAGAQGMRVHRYWDPEPLVEGRPVPDDELADRFAALMDQAVSRCITGSDTISLSGGIDSPAVAAFAAPRHLERGGKPLQAMTAVYPKHPAVDERKWVEILVERFGIPLHTFELQRRPDQDLERWVVLTDGPYRAASMALYAEHYEIARSLGARTALTGEHAEFVYALDWYLLDHLITHGRLGPLRRQLRNRHDRGRSWPTLARAMAEAVAPGRLLAARELRRRRGLPDWIDGPKASRAVAEEITSAPQRWRRLQVSAFRGPGLSSEAVGICQEVTRVQARRPWADVDLFEFFLGLPAEQKFPDASSKNLVRRLLKGRVPDEILQRRDKTVFDDAALANIDYSTFDRYLVDPPHRFSGVDYAMVAERLRGRSLTLVDYNWMRQLANAHAFLAHGDRRI